MTESIQNKIGEKKEDLMDVLQIKDILNNLSLRTTNSLEWFYDNYSAKIYGIALHATNNHVDAEEILLKVFNHVITCGKLQRFENIKEFEDWICKISAGFSLLNLRFSKGRNRLFQTKIEDFAYETKSIKQDAIV